jgi:hypothetical protein
MFKELAGHQDENAQAGFLEISLHEENLAVCRYISSEGEVTIWQKRLLQRHAQQSVHSITWIYMLKGVAKCENVEK